MVDSIRLSLTLVFALHLPLLSWMALFNTSEDCDVAAVAHVKIENEFTLDANPNTGPSNKVKFDPFDSTKPICIGMLDVAQISTDATELLTDQVSSVSAALAYEAYESNTTNPVLDRARQALGWWALASKKVRTSIFSDLVTRTLDELDSVTESVSFSVFEETITSLSDETKNLPKWECDKNDNYICKKSNATSAALYANLSSCVSSCRAPNVPDAFTTKSNLRSAKQSSQVSYDMCGSYFKTLAPELASACKGSSEGECDLDKIFGNLSSTCSTLEWAGIIMYIGFALSYIMIFGVLVGTYGTQTNRMWAISLLVIYCVIFLIFLSSFVIYTVTLYGEGYENYFWQPLRKGLQEGFGDPVDRYWGTFDKVTIVPDTGFIYLVWILIMNIGVITVISVSLAETEKDFGLYKKIGGKEKPNRVVETSRMYF